MPMDRRRYPSNWRAISRAIRERAGWRCEWCGAAQGALTANAVREGSRGVVVLTVAHLGQPRPDGSPGSKHDKQDCRPENLAALCQACHLHFDIDEHIVNARVTRTRKRLRAAHVAGQIPLMEVPEP